MIAEERGKIIGIRVLPDGKVEVPVQQSGKLLGVEQTDIVTYLSVARPDGTPYGEADGVVMTKEGKMASFKAQGIGRLKAGGAVIFSRLNIQPNSISEDGSPKRRRGRF